ncbi:integrase [Fusibacter tunisiensis]|uniref:Integrase n=2 Tax=Fusibacter tunisiensis TaxID=1008308 RepID=A0ABS2MTL7_9FIRM|nr:integrase [Fusibacter tunisiensis]
MDLKNRIQDLLKKSPSVQKKKSTINPYTKPKLIPQVNVHVDYELGMVLIKQGKGRKDRITSLSERLIIQLNHYKKLYFPREYMFENPMRNGPITERTLQKVFEQACTRACITKVVSFHSMRHSFATHLLESTRSPGISKKTSYFLNYHSIMQLASLIPQIIC